MKILVFGGAGFLGRHVSMELRRRGHQVTVFDSALEGSDFQSIRGDIRQADSVDSAVGQGFDAVYNFAGLADLNASLDAPQLTFQLNVAGNINVLESCRQHNIKRYVYASTVYVHSDKGSFYGISKRTSEDIIEEYAKRWNLNYSIIRYGSVYGCGADHQNRIYRLIHQALTEGRITFLGDGQEEREYIHVSDAARLSVDILESNEFINQHVMLTGVERFSYRQLLQMIREMFDHKIEIDFLNKEYRGHYTMTPFTFRPQKARKLVANPFVDFGQGLLEVIHEINSDIKCQYADKYQPSTREGFNETTRCGDHQSQRT